MRKRFRFGFVYVCLLPILLNVIPYVVAGKSQEYSYSGNIGKDELTATRRKDQDRNADYDMDHRDEMKRTVLNRRKRSNAEISPSMGDGGVASNDPAASGSVEQEENSDVKLISDASGRGNSFNDKEKRNVLGPSKKRSLNRKISSGSQKGSLDSRVQLSNLSDKKINQDNGEDGSVDESRVESDDSTYDDDGASSVDDDTVGQSDKGDAPGDDARSSDENLEKIDSDRVSLGDDPEARIVKRNVDREEEYEEIDDRDAVRNSVGLIGDLEQDARLSNEEALGSPDKERTDNVQGQGGESLKRATGQILENSRDENQEKKDNLKSNPEQGESMEHSEDLKRNVKLDSEKNSEILNDDGNASGDRNVEILKNSVNENFDRTGDSEDSKRETKAVNEKGVSKESEEEQSGSQSKDKDSDSNLENVETPFENMKLDEGTVDMEGKEGESEADYAKRVERQIQKKIDSIKEEIKRDVEEKQKIREIEENNAKYDELQSKEDEDENSQSLDTALEQQQQQTPKRSTRQVAPKRPLQRRSRRRISKRARSENSDVEHQLRQIEKVDKLDPSVYEKAQLLHESIRKRSTPLKDDVSETQDENKRIFMKKRDVPRRVTLVESEPLKNRRKRKIKSPIVNPEQAHVNVQDDLPSDLLLDSNLKLSPSSMESSRIKRNSPGYERSRRSGAATSRGRESSLRYRPQLDDENDDGNEFDDNGLEDSTSNFHSRVYADPYSSLVQYQEDDNTAEDPGSYLFANRAPGSAMRRKRGGFDSKRKKRALAEPANENKMESVVSLVGSSQELSPKLASEYKEAFGGLQGDPGGALARFKRIKRVLRVS